MSGGWDELIREAEAQLAGQEVSEQEASAELGESVDLSEHEAFAGRWRGYGKAFTKRGEVDVYLLWDVDDARRFVWPKTRLQREIDELRPDLGDEIVIVRGIDIPASGPDRSPTQRFAVKVRRCDDPLPEEEPSSERSTAGPGASLDEDMPFMPML